MSHTSRNSLLKPGVARLSRSKVFSRRALYKKKKVAGKREAKPAAKEAPAAAKPSSLGDITKDLKKALVYNPSLVPNEKAPKAPKARKTLRPAKLRASITPGTVLIILAGRFRGKRVVFLKQLESGLLLVTGPYKVNGVPLRRVNQAYVIATSTKVSLEGVKLDIDDTYFKREAKNAEDKISADKVATQKAVDSQLVANISKIELLSSYLSKPFSLSKGQYPHDLKF
ncbi:60S ribosomal protein L6 [Spiromyces aspiralis]|uniref:60S ribosomal protein L6 n=1 Tax=Spiromyces aspiralis TaxID=68401 RepID=A0ACC1HI61_9FUNG|nr:60S ribosomal protein L6 [Spiromyces aspiralis]